MMNINKDKPKTELHGRLKYSIDYIDKIDIKEKKILNIGCGYGWLELDILRYNPKNIIAIEPSEEKLETAKIYVKDKRVKFTIGDGLSLPFSDNSFDTVICFEVIEHLQKGMEKKFFSEVSRILRKGGVFYLSTPNNNLLSIIFDPAWWIIGHRHYNYIFLNKIAQKYNLICKKYSIKGKWWSLIGILNLYISKWIFRRNPFFFKIITLKEDKEYKKKGFVNLFIAYKKT